MTTQVNDKSRYPSTNWGRLDPWEDIAPPSAVWEGVVRRAFIADGGTNEEYHELFVKPLLDRGIEPASQVEPTGPDRGR